MALVLGVTNLLWMILLSSLVFLEKFTSVGRQIAAFGGIILVAAGAWFLGTG
jgi:predicted metal-binding membrane protein